MLQYINGEIFASAMFEGTRVLSLFLGSFFTLLLFLFLMKRVARNICLGLFCHKKKFLHTVSLLQEKHGLFVRKIVHLFCGFLLIFFSYTVTNILLIVFGAFLDHHTLSAFTLNEIRDIQYSPLQAEAMKIFTHLMTYSGLIIVVILFMSGFFVMLGSFVSFFQKIAYLLLTLVIFFFFFAVIAGTYVNIFDKVLELNPHTIQIQPAK